MTEADMQAMREMGEWVMGATADTGYRNVEVDCDRSHLEAIEVMVSQDNYRLGVYFMDYRAATIAEAWDKIKQQEGFPR